MSINSKSRRDARKKKPVRRTAARPAAPIIAHAHLRDEAGAVAGGAGLREDEWVVVLDGRAIANTDSAGMVLAMLRHLVALRERTGQRLRLDCSDTLREAAAREAEAAGQTLDAYLDFLEAERVEHAERKLEAPARDAFH